MAHKTALLGRTGEVETCEYSEGLLKLPWRSDYGNAPKKMLQQNALSTMVRIIPLHSPLISGLFQVIIFDHLAALIGFVKNTVNI